jgi:hypothetical protein
MVSGASTVISTLGCDNSTCTIRLFSENILSVTTHYRSALFSTLFFPLYLPAHHLFMILDSIFEGETGSMRGTIPASRRMNTVRSSLAQSHRG